MPTASAGTADVDPAPVDVYAARHHAPPRSIDGQRRFDATRAQEAEQPDHFAARQRKRSIRNPLPVRFFLIKDREVFDPAGGTLPVRSRA